MGAVSELYAMQRSFSADRQVKHQSRSGDDQDGGAVVLDFLANVQSAEADIIESEERAEQQESKREFAALLRAYFKRILTADEYRFLVGCIRQNKTLYQVGRTLGVSANKTAESIESKCKASEKQFFLLMSYSGYDCRRGCEFMTRLFNPDAHRRKVRDKIQARRAAISAYKRRYNLLHPEVNKRARKKYNQAHPDRVRESSRRYAERNHEKELARYKRRNEKRKNDPEYKAQSARWRAEWRAKHRDELIAKKRAYRARKKAEAIAAGAVVKKRGRPRKEGATT